ADGLDHQQVHAAPAEILPGCAPLTGLHTTDRRQGAKRKSRGKPNRERDRHRQKDCTKQSSLGTAPAHLLTCYHGFPHLIRVFYSFVWPSQCNSLGTIKVQREISQAGYLRRSLL